MFGRKRKKQTTATEAVSEVSIDPKEQALQDKIAEKSDSLAHFVGKVNSKEWMTNTNLEEMKETLFQAQKGHISEDLGKYLVVAYNGLYSPKHAQAYQDVVELIHQSVQGLGASDPLDAELFDQNNIKSMQVLDAKMHQGRASTDYPMPTLLVLKDQLGKSQLTRSFKKYYRTVNAGAGHSEDPGRKKAYLDTVKLFNKVSDRVAQNQKENRHTGNTPKAE